MRIRTRQDLYQVIGTGKIAMKRLDKEEVKRVLQDINTFKNKGFDLFSRQFLGISINDSISAVAVPLETTLKYFLLEAAEFLKPTKSDDNGKKL